MKYYRFPFNYDYANKFLGIFDYKVLTIIIIYALLVAYILSILSLSFWFKIGAFLFLVLPIAFLLSTSIHNEPVYLFLFFVLKHHFTSHKYIHKT